MGNCASSAQDADGKARSDMIDRQIEEDSKRYKRECKILLLGKCATPILCLQRGSVGGGNGNLCLGECSPHPMMGVNGACGSHSDSQVTGLRICSQPNTEHAIFVLHAYTQIPPVPTCSCLAPSNAFLIHALTLSLRQAPASPESRQLSSK